MISGRMCRQLDAEADDQAAAQKLSQANAYMARLEATLQQQSAIAQEAAAELERLRSRVSEVQVRAGKGLPWLTDRVR
jgi:flagellar biosynthesis chaperone FliJ